MRAFGLGILLVCVSAIGCAPDFRTQCEAQVQCRGGNDADIEACVAVSEVGYDFAEDIECADEFDAYFECQQPLLKCRSSNTGQMCPMGTECSKDESCSNGQCTRSSYTIDSADADKCKVEAAAYGQCANF